MLNQVNRVEIAKWVAESQRPFSIVEDGRFKNLMNTGCPDYYIPSQYTVARDVKQVFKKTRNRIAKMLQVSQQKKVEGILNPKISGI
jgi:outer membrane protein W